MCCRFFLTKCKQSPSDLIAQWTSLWVDLAGVDLVGGGYDWGRIWLLGGHDWEKTWLGVNMIGGGHGWGRTWLWVDTVGKSHSSS